jgi:hypothetical protein
MDSFLSYAGVAGALLCVGMYAAVSAGKVSAERPAFYLVNGIGSIFIFSSAAQQFDVGDIGSVGQEFIWAAISFFGAARAWALSNEQRMLAHSFL